MYVFYEFIKLKIKFLNLEKDKVPTLFVTFKSLRLKVLKLKRKITFL